MSINNVPKKFIENWQGASAHLHNFFTAYVSSTWLLLQPQKWFWSLRLCEKKNPNFNVNLLFEDISLIFIDVDWYLLSVTNYTYRMAIIIGKIFIIALCNVFKKTHECTNFIYLMAIIWRKNLLKNFWNKIAYSCWNMIS